MSEMTEPHSTTFTFGFWIYLMTDCVLFACLFAAFAVLRTQTFGGPSGKDLFDLPFVLAETLILLTSSFTCGLGLLSAQAEKLRGLVGWFAATFLLGASFLTLELNEFSHLVHEGNGPGRSAFLSSFFSLVATHGLHIFAGLLTLLVILFMASRRGFTSAVQNNIATFGLFWHFLDIVWIFIFTLVYLLGTY